MIFERLTGIFGINLEAEVALSYAQFNAVASWSRLMINCFVYTINLRQVWYLIVSIPDHCCLSFFASTKVEESRRFRRQTSYMSTIITTMLALKCICSCLIIEVISLSDCALTQCCFRKINAYVKAA